MYFGTLPLVENAVAKYVPLIGFAKPKVINYYSEMNFGNISRIFFACILDSLAPDCHFDTVKISAIATLP